ncbi:hypothetical protein MHTCC0001_35780 [Flavobacteriaceae bacterium MHTCC 0001]
MKYIILAIFGLSFYNAGGQQKSFVPKTGELFFKQEQVIVNNQKLDSTLKYKKPMLFSMLKDFAVLQYRESKLPIDTTAIYKNFETNMQPVLDSILDPRNSSLTPTKHIYEFQDTIIKTQYIKFPKDKNEVTVIDRKTGDISFFVIKDSILEPDLVRLGIRTKESNKNIIIKEYKHIRKTIGGYDCFKIVVTKTENLLKAYNFYNIKVPEEFKDKYQKLLESIVEKTFYVTRQIECKYHPATSLSEVLDKYYPLEVIEKDSFLDGVEKRYTLEKITVK